MMVANKFLILVVAIIVLLVAYIAYVNVSKAPSNTTSTSLPTTTVIQKNYMTPPSQAIGNYTFVSASPFYPISSIPAFSNGYVRGAMFTYSYLNNHLLLRFLVYSNKTNALNAYSYISNYSINSTVTPLAPLPPNFAGVEILQANITFYSVSVLRNNTVITTTLVKPLAASYKNSYIIGLLVNASKLLFNQSETT